MENNATTIEMLFEKAENYTRTTVELTKLSAIDKTSDVLSSLLARLTVSIVIVLFIFFFTIGLSLWIGELLGKSYYGFFVLSIAYFLVSILLHYNKKRWIKMPISNYIIVKMLKKR
jgi:hypothetical protein